MAERNRRIGCGCLPLVVLFFIGSAFLASMDDPDAPDGIMAFLLPALIGVGVLAAIAVAAQSRRRASEDQDRAEDGMPSPTASPSDARTPKSSDPRPGRSYQPPSAPPVEDLATDNLRRELKDAVEDLREGRLDEPRRPLTSEEMIARAKRRLSDYGGTSDDE